MKDANPSTNPTTQRRTSFLSAIPQVVSEPSAFWTAFLLALFLGIFGAHRFYARKSKSGTLQLVTLGLFGVWTLVDVVTILLSRFQNSSGLVYRNPKPVISWGIFMVSLSFGVIGFLGSVDKPYFGDYTGSNLQAHIEKVRITIGSEGLIAEMDIKPAHITHFGRITKITKVDDDTYNIEAIAKVLNNTYSPTPSEDIEVRCRWHKGQFREQDSVEYSDSKTVIQLSRNKLYGPSPEPESQESVSQAGLRKQYAGIYKTTSGSISSVGELCLFSNGTYRLTFGPGSEFAGIWSVEEPAIRLKGLDYSADTILTITRSKQLEYERNGLNSVFTLKERE